MRRFCRIPGRWPPRCSRSRANPPRHGAAPLRARCHERRRRDSTGGRWPRPSIARPPATTLPRSCSSGCAPSCSSGCSISRSSRERSSIWAPAPARASLALQRRYPRARVIALDIAPGMLKAAPRPGWPRPRFQRVCADAYALPLAARSVDLVYSSLMLQWCDRPDRVFASWRACSSPAACWCSRASVPIHCRSCAWPGRASTDGAARQPVPRHAATGRGADARRDCSSR